MSFGEFEMKDKRPYADIVFYNARVYTADSNDCVHEALAVKNGYVIAVGFYTQIAHFVGEHTQKYDALGKTIIPGLVDCHLHAFWGGSQLLSCSLNYQTLTIEQTLRIIQDYLDQDPIKDDTAWLPVRAWYRSGMLPAGADMNRDILDSLDTKRPIVLFANDCHTLAANSRALSLLGIDETIENPIDGKYYRAEDGRLNGIIDDAPCMRAFDEATKLNTEQAVQLADKVQRALNEQGITTTMDARVYTEHLDAFKTLKQRKQLTLRFLGAKEITPVEAGSVSMVQESVQKITDLAKRYNPNIWQPEPDIGICSIKFFIDGVLQAPMCTAYLLAPYLENRGTKTKPNWTRSKNRGDLYFSEPIIDDLLVSCAQANINPHFHTVGDGAIEVVLNSVEKMKHTYPDTKIRPTFAHNELVAPHQFKRFANLDVTATLSFQWAGVANLDELDVLGKERSKGFEAHAKFIDAGARIAFNSDWPIDSLAIWDAFQVGMTRKMICDPKEQSPRLDNDRDLTLLEVLRAATINAAYTLGKEQYIGSLEEGKLADLVVLDRNIFELDKNEVAQVKVLLTMVGGDIVFQR